MLTIVLRTDDDFQFRAMQHSYRKSGGLARVHEVAERFHECGSPDPSRLDQWIERREVICFHWREQAWLPWFQFNRFELAPHRQLQPVFAELNPVFDGWELGTWFARPNAWLGDRLPVHAVMADLPAVLDAARADRFIACG